MKTFGERMRQRRNQLGITQTDVALLCGWDNQGRVNNYEKDRREPTFTDAIKIAESLKCKVEWLSFGVGHPTDFDEKTLSQRIIDRRSELGLNQSQLAKRVGIAQQSLHAIENGKIEFPRNIKKIADSLFCKPAWLLFGIGEKPKPINRHCKTCTCGEINNEFK